MSDKKAPNYTEAQTAEIVARYDSCNTDADRAECLETLSAETGRGVKSIRAKLVREKVYVKKAYVSKAGTPSETKEVIVQAIAKAMGVYSDQLTGLEKATKNTLKLLRGTLEVARQLSDDSEGEENS